MSEFSSKKPLRFVFDVFISQPNDLVEEFASLLSVNFGVYYL